MMNPSNPDRLNFSHNGDHHQASIAVNPTTKEITAGAAYNFGNNSGAQMKIENGKADLGVQHAGDTHAFAAFLHGDGSYGGSYRDLRHGLDLEFTKSGVLGTLPQANVKYAGDHHKVNLATDAKGRVSGSIESKATKSSSFKVLLQDGKVSEAAFTHKGAKHTTSVTADRDGWKATVQMGNGKSGFSIDVQDGNKGLKAAAGFNARF